MLWKLLLYLHHVYFVCVLFFPDLRFFISLFISLFLFLFYNTYLYLFIHFDSFLGSFAIDCSFTCLLRFFCAFVYFFLDLFFLSSIVWVLFSFFFGLFFGISSSCSLKQMLLPSLLEEAWMGKNNHFITFSHLCYFLLWTPHNICFPQGALPLRGSIPDMTADSKRYIELQNM